MSYNIIIVNNSKTINLLKKAINSSKIIALDTEFIRKTTYYPQLSILQICTENDTAYILDYLEYPDIVLDILNTIYTSNTIKVFHSAKNDLEILYNLTGKLPSNIFDTQIAFMAISPLECVSYAHLINNLLNITLDKSETLSNWTARPITEKQIEYAALDVIMLYKVYFVLFEKLKQQNRLTFIEDKLQNLEKCTTYSFNIDKEVIRFIKQNNVNKNTPLLAALINCRQNLAQQHNVPKQYILDDSLIRNIVKYPKKLNSIINKNKYLNDTLITEIKNLAITEFKYLNNNLVNHKLPQHKLLFICVKLLDFISNQENINKDLICNKNDLNSFLIWHSDMLHKKLDLIPTKNLEKFFNTWRYEVFTKQLLSFLTGKLYMMIDNDSLVFKNIKP